MLFGFRAASGGHPCVDDNARESAAARVEQTSLSSLVNPVSDHIYKVAVGELMDSSGGALERTIAALHHVRVLVLAPGSVIEGFRWTSLKQKGPLALQSNLSRILVRTHGESLFSLFYLVFLLFNATRSDQFNVSLLSGRESRH
jgi:hypothetical protein